MQLLVFGVPVGRAREKRLLEGLPPRVVGGSDINSHGSRSGARGAHSW